MRQFLAGSGTGTDSTNSPAEKGLTFSVGGPVNRSVQTAFHS